jgi:uncharacterized protein YgiM (DUF1202 family)
MHRYPFRQFARVVLAFLSLLASSACVHDSGDVIGQAFVAPATLNLRRQLTQKTNPVATLKHGDRVAILEVRRRFVRVRAASRAEGWVDATDLLSTDDINRIREERRRASLLPSEGAATVYEALNIHVDPTRQSAAFAQIPEGTPIEVLAYRIAPRTSGPREMPNFGIEHPAPAVAKRNRKERTHSLRLPPPPSPPKPPANWEELSAQRIPGVESTAQKKAERDAEAKAKKVQQQTKAVPMESWTLVRTRANQFGWVLSRNLVLSIPDEVAQYAEGKRITSYFDLGAVNDEEKGLKHNWLWTTASGVQPFDFDAWRVFLWNRRRHRYETSYRQRDLEGYFPVQVDPRDPGAFGRTFRLIAKDDDGKFRQRTYVFDGTLVHLTGTADYRAGAIADAESAASESAESKLPAKNSPGWLQRFWSSLRGRFSKRAAQ